jgi:hypothetical protein
MRARRRAEGIVTKASRTVKAAVKLSQKTAQQARKAAVRPPKTRPAVQASAPLKLKRKGSKAAGAAARGVSQAAHAKRRQAHVSSRGRRRQASRDAKG